MKFKEGLVSFGNNKIYNKILDFLCPVALTLYSFMNVNKGLEITDTAYNYTNFRYPDRLDNMWYYSTFLSNALGSFFTKLPGGHTMLGLNIYTGIIKLLCILSAYFFMTRRVKIRKEAATLGLFMAAGICWCPTALLYNYLTYLLVTWGVILIFEAETASDTRKASTAFLLAGFVLGANVFVRLPNLCEAALIVGVWFASFIKKDSFKKAIKDTLLCLIGYLGAFAVLLLCAGLSRSFESYLRGIKEMLGGGGASQYGSVYMLLFTAFSGYIGIFSWFKYLCGFAIVLLLAGFILPSRRKLDPARITVAVIGALGLFVIFTYTNLYTYKYYEYSSMYGINVIALIISLFFLAFTALTPGCDMKLRIVSALAIIVVLVTPLGSNNGMYSILNNLFLVFPLTMNVFFCHAKNSRKVSPLLTGLAIVVFVALIHSVRFGATFSFRDGGGLRMNTEVEGNAVTKGMKTVPSNAENLSEATKVWKDGYENSTVIAFGNAAGLCFYLDGAPAISTAWPSLESFAYDKYVNEMNKVRAAYINDEVKLPVIILGTDATDTLSYIVLGEDVPPEFALGESYVKKLDILWNFLRDYNYDVIYGCDSFTMFAPEK